VSEMREPEAVASSGGYYTVQESAPEVDPSRRSVPGPVAGAGSRRDSIGLSCLSSTWPNRDARRWPLTSK